MITPALVGSVLAAVLLFVAGFVAASDRLAIAGRVGLAQPTAPRRPRSALKFLRWRAARRRGELIHVQLADAIRAIAAGLRSGSSLSSSIAFAAAECPDPIAGLLRDLVAREASGSPLDGELDRWATEARDDDVGLAVAVLRMHRRTGGDLPAVLDGLGRTLEERRAAKREISSLTAQARMSGLVVGLLPIGFFGFLTITSPHDMAVAYATPVGAAAITAGIALEVGAFLWIRRLLRIT